MQSYLKITFIFRLLSLLLFLNSSALNAQWSAVGGAGFTSNTASNVSMTIDGSTPYIAFSDGANSSKVTVMKYNGTTWEIVGTSGFTPSSASDLSLVVNGGTPYVAYSYRAHYSRNFF